MKRWTTQELRVLASRSDGVELCPVRYFTVDGERVAEPEPGQRPAERWGVYFTLKAGHVEWVSDHLRRGCAFRMIRRLLRYIRDAQPSSKPKLYRY